MLKVALGVVVAAVKNVQQIVALLLKEITSLKIHAQMPVAIAVVLLAEEDAIGIVEMLAQVLVEVVALGVEAVPLEVALGNVLDAVKPVLGVALNAKADVETLVFMIAELLAPLFVQLLLNNKKERIILNDNFKRFTNTK